MSLTNFLVRHLEGLHPITYPPTTADHFFDFVLALTMKFSAQLLALYVCNASAFLGQGPKTAAFSKLSLSSSDNYIESLAKAGTAPSISSNTDDSARVVRNR